MWQTDRQTVLPQHIPCFATILYNGSSHTISYLLRYIFTLWDTRLSIHQSMHQTIGNRVIQQIMYDLQLMLMICSSYICVVPFPRFLSHWWKLFIFSPTSISVNRNLSTIFSALKQEWCGYYEMKTTRLHIKPFVTNDSFTDVQKCHGMYCTLHNDNQYKSFTS